MSAGSPTDDGADAGAGTESVASLLATGDVDFVQRSYRSVLHREPDEGGLASYVGLLRMGADKSRLLIELAISPEARRLEPRLAGLAELLRAPPKRMSVWGRLLNGLWLRPLGMSPGCSERHLRIIENQLHLQRQLLERQSAELALIRRELTQLAQPFASGAATSAVGTAAPAPQGKGLDAVSRVLPWPAQSRLDDLLDARRRRLGT